MVEPFLEVQETLRVMTIFLNLALVVLFYYLRMKGRVEPMTISQKWGLSILIWLFLLNSMTLCIELIGFTSSAHPDLISVYYLSRVSTDIDILIGMSLLAFGFVFPRPYTNWKRLQFILIGILGAMFIMLFLQLSGHSSDDQMLYQNFSFSGWAYMLGWFIPLVLWIPLLDKEGSVQGRMVLTFLIWAFISAPIRSDITSIFLMTQMPLSSSPYTLMTLGLFIYVMARLIRYLWNTKDRWEAPEKVNIGFLAFFILTTLFSMKFSDRTNGLIFLVDYISANATWTILRPALLSYAILRYQIFGPRSRIARPLNLIMALLGVFLVVVLVLGLPLGISIFPKFGLGTLIGLLLFVPFYRYSRTQINRHLPMMRGEGMATMREKRGAYLISLQTAVVKGKIDLRVDEENLKEQRSILGISEREHDLLMESFAAKDIKVQPSPVMDELFLVNIDGRLLAHVARKVEGKGRYKEKDKDIVAGMLVAIRDYVREGLRTGTKRSLETIKYGDYNLLIEGSGKLVLAAVVKGPDSPSLRQDLADQLNLIRRRHGPNLEDWDGDRDRTDGARHILEGFMEEMDLL